MLESEVQIADRRPLRVMFVITSMPVGGAETLLVDLVRRMDRARFAPEVCCLKEAGPLGEVLAREIPVFTHLVTHKYNPRILGRMTGLLRRRQVDAVITVGAGDKMFWGRLAAWRAGVPVVLSALHSTGWPDSIGRLNRLLTPITDGFIAVAARHGDYLVAREHFPRGKVHVIYNGVDVERFAAGRNVSPVRAQLGCPAGAPVATIVAALRPEKNHDLLLEAAQTVRGEVAGARFWIVGDGPERSRLEALTCSLGLQDAVTFLGTRHDVPELLAASDVFVLTSRMEANPVSILEAMAAGKPVVAPAVGSIPEVVVGGATGHLFNPGRADEVARYLISLLSNRRRAAEMGQAAQRRVRAHWSLEQMVAGYEKLIEDIYFSKRPQEARESAASLDWQSGSESAENAQEQLLEASAT